MICFNSHIASIDTLNISRVCGMDQAVNSEIDGALFLPMQSPANNTAGLYNYLQDQLHKLTTTELRDHELPENSFHK